MSYVHGLLSRLSPYYVLLTPCPAVMAPSTRNLLSRYDLNGDGRLDAQEVEAVVEKLVQEEMRSRWV